MLKKSNNTYLKEKYPNQLVYFIQLWGELLDARTIDIYQHNIMNAFLAMKELLQVAEDTLRGVYESPHNLEDCRNETAALLKDDDIIEKINPQLHNSLRNRIHAKIESKENRIGLCAQLRSSLRHIESNYLNTIFSELKNDIHTEQTKQINKHTKMLVSQCIHDGWSQKALMEMSRFLRKEEGDGDSFEEKWSKFRDVLSAAEGVLHEVYIELSIQTTSAEKKETVIRELSSMGCPLLRGVDIMGKYDMDLSSLVNSNKTYLFIEQHSHDVYSAAIKSLQDISDKINLISFYGLINFWNISDTTIFVVNPVTKYRRSFAAESLFVPYEYIDITNRVFEKTKDIFSNRDENNITEKLSGAFAYTNISKASMFQEARFINLWVALESLVRTDLYKDIITNLKEVVPAACARRYLFSVIRNFIEDCKRCEVTLAFDTYENIDIENKQESVEKMLYVFSQVNLYNELYNKTAVNSLLQERCSEIHELVSDCEKLKTRLENHYKMIKWQIQRLYRIRNEITHSAVQRGLSTVHIKHLFSYLTTTILEIIAVENKGHFKNLDEIYCKITGDYSCAVELLSHERNNSVIKDTILKSGFIDLL